jgi:predicted ABC-type ATPase
VSTASARPKRGARAAPSLEELLSQVSLNAGTKPVAFVLAGHNGSGKSTLWHDRLAPRLQMPLVNADRLVTSILPAAGADGHLVPWAAKLRDEDGRWQQLAQAGVSAFMGLITERKMAFGFETVFSDWRPQPAGSVRSTIDTIKALQEQGYLVVLIFVGLARLQISIGRVDTRKQQGGHDVKLAKLRARFPRTRRAVSQAAPSADMMVMFDNSLDSARRSGWPARSAALRFCMTAVSCPTGCRRICAARPAYGWMRSPRPFRGVGPERYCVGNEPVQRLPPRQQRGSALLAIHHGRAHRRSGPMSCQPDPRDPHVFAPLLSATTSPSALKMPIGVRAAAKHR